MVHFDLSEGKVRKVGKIRKFGGIFQSVSMLHKMISLMSWHASGMFRIYMRTLPQCLALLSTSSTPIPAVQIGYFDPSEAKIHKMSKNHTIF